MKLLSKFLLVFAFYLFSPNYLSAQNFTVLNADRTYYFEKYGQFYAVAVDSVKVVDSDTIYHHFLHFRDTANQSMHVCVDVYGGSFFGKTNIWDSSGVFHLITFRNDTVRLIPDAGLNDSWLMYKYNNGHYLEASITGIDTLIVFGFSELVKNMSITAKNQNGDILSGHPFHNKSLLLSEHNGLLNTFDFYMFPTDTTRYSLTGVTNPIIGKVMTYKDYFDYEEGDIFHIIERDLFYEWDGGTSHYIHSGFIKRYIKTVIEKTIYNPDTAVSYIFGICTQTFVYTQGIKDTVYSTDTVFTTYNYNQVQDTTFTLLPFQTFYADSVFGYDKRILYLYRENNILGKTVHVYYDRTDVAFWDTCWQYIMADPMPPSHKYIEGCGGPYSYFEDWMGIVRERKLQYFKKGNETWGVPLAADCQALLSSSVAKFEQAIRFNVFPNPASDELHIEIPVSLPLNIEVFNMHGMSVLKTSISKHKIDISHLSSGMYYIHVADKQNPTYIARFIKH